MKAGKQYSSSISSKGQVTVPQEIRNRLGLAAGDRIDFVIDGDRTVIRPSRSQVNPFEKFVGIAGPFPGGEEGIKAWINDMRSDDMRSDDMRSDDMRDDGMRSDKYDEDKD